MADVDNTQPTDEKTEGLVFKSSKKKEVERVPLFTIDDREYTVPKKPGKSVVMKYLNTARKTGNDLMAAQTLAETLLGEEAWENFLNWEGHDEPENDEVMSTVLSKCIELAVGSFEDTSKK